MIVVELTLRTTRMLLLGVDHNLDLFLLFHTITSCSVCISALRYFALNHSAFSGLDGFDKVFHIHY